MRRVRSIGLATALLAALALLVAPAAAPAADPDRAIVIYDQDTQALASFPRVNCRVTGKGNDRKFKAKATHEGWKLDVRANDFSGFHDYDIEYGIRRTNFTVTPPGDKGFFANFFFPGDHPPKNGGELTLAGNGKRMGLGFIAAFSSRSDDDAVLVVGKAKCRYPKKR